MIRTLAMGALLTGFATSAVAQTILVPRNSDWKYEDSGVALDSTWKDPGFDDSSWSEAPGILGYGEPYIDSIVSYGPDPNDKHRTTYFRHEFTSGVDPVTVQTLFARANFDDGLVIYLNGTEVAREYLPPVGTILYATLADLHEGGSYALIEMPSGAAVLTDSSNVLAVEVHQAGATSSDLVMDLELAYATDTFVMRGPYLQRASGTEVTVRVRFDVSADARLQYGLSPGALSTIVDDVPVKRNHRFTITGLSPGTKYYYSVGTIANQIVGGDEDHYFVTAPTPGQSQPTRVWVTGDSGLPGEGARDVRDAYVQAAGTQHTDVWLMLGDNAYESGTDFEYQAGLFDMYPQILRNTVLWPTRGNHDDLLLGGNNDYYDFFILPQAGESGGVPSGTEKYYSFDHGATHFVCLDSEGSPRGPTGAMLTWLSQDLAANASDWTIAYWHHPPYTKGSHDSDDPADSGGRMRDMRENALPLLEGAGVDLVLCGHSHSYERSFLLNGHYAVSDSLMPVHVIDGGDGRIGSDGAYTKATLGPGPDEGTVYAVPGSASKTSGGPLSHPVMVSSLDVLGSMVLEIAGARLDATFLTDAGAVLDSFTIVKGAVTSAPPAETPAAIRLAAGPNPFRAATALRFRVPDRARVRVDVFDVAGRRVTTLFDEEMEAGERSLRWDGRSARGRAVAPGVYFAVLRADDDLRALRLVHAR